MSRIWMSHVTHKNESCPHVTITRVTHTNWSCHTCEWVKCSHFQLSTHFPASSSWLGQLESHCNHWWSPAGVPGDTVVSKLSQRWWTCREKWWQLNKSETLDIQLRRVTSACICTSCHTNSFIHVIRSSCHCVTWRTDILWAMSQKEPCHTCKWVMSHIWMSRVTYHQEQGGEGVDE